MRDKKISAEIEKLNDWVYNGDVIAKVYDFIEFNDAIGFVNRVARIANEHDHHPDIDIRYDKVMLSLKTHSKGKVTEKDIELAKAIDG